MEGAWEVYLVRQWTSLSVSLSLFSLSLSLSHTHTHTHTLSLSLFLSFFLFSSLSLSLLPYSIWHNFLTAPSSSSIIQIHSMGVTKGNRLTSAQ